MGMPRRRKGARILGPHPHGDGFRVREVAADGSAQWSPTFATKSAAQAYKEGAEQQIISGELTTTSALEHYGRYLDAKGNKKDSKRQTLWAVGQFFPEETPLWVLRPAWFSKRYMELTELFSVASHRSMLAQVKTFLNWCVEQKWVKENPAAGVKGLGRRNTRKPQLRRKEAQAYHAKCWELENNGGHDGAFACLIDMYMGLRAGCELAVIRVRDLDDYEEPCDTLWVPDSKSEAGRRTLEVPEELRPGLVARTEGRDGDEFLFPAKRGATGHHWRDWVTECSKDICKLAGVPYITSHGLRGLLATIGRRSGKVDLSEYLGHEEDRTTNNSYAARGSVQVGVRRKGLKVLAGGKNSIPQQEGSGTEEIGSAGSNRPASSGDV